MPFLYAKICLFYMSKIGPNPGLPANFHILQDAIDLFFNSFTLSSHQNLNAKGTAK